MIIKCVLYFAFFILLFSNCRKDQMITGDRILINTEAPIMLEGYTPPFQAVTASVFGQIFNENNDPIEGVTITVEDHETMTDQNGLFSLSDIGLNAEGSLVIALSLIHI